MPDTPENRNINDDFKVYNDDIRNAQSENVRKGMKEILQAAQKNMDEKKEEIFKKFMDEKYPDNPEFSREEKNRNDKIREIDDPMFLDREQREEFVKYMDEQDEIAQIRNKAIDEIVKKKEERMNRLEQLTGKKGEFESSKIAQLQNEALEEKLRLEEEKKRLEDEINTINDKIASLEGKEENQAEIDNLKSELGKRNEELSKVNSDQEKLAETLSKLCPDEKDRSKAPIMRDAVSVYKDMDAVGDQTYEALATIFGEENIPAEQAKKILGEKKYNDRITANQNRKVEEAKKTLENDVQNNRNSNEQQVAEQQQRGGPQVAFGGGTPMGASFANQQPAQASQQVEQPESQEQSVPNSSEIAAENLRWIGYDGTALNARSARALLKNFVDNPDKQMDILMDEKSRNVIRDAMEKAGKTRNPIAALRFNKTKKELLNLGETSLQDKAVQQYEAMNGKPHYRTLKGNEYNEIVDLYNKQLIELEEAVKKEGSTPELSERFEELEKRYAPIIGVVEFKDAATKNMVKKRIKLADRVKTLIGKKDKLLNQAPEDKKRNEKEEAMHQKAVDLQVEKYMALSRDELADLNTQNLNPLQQEALEKAISQRQAEGWKDGKKNISGFTTGNYSKVEKEEVNNEEKVNNEKKVEKKSRFESTKADVEKLGLVGAVKKGVSQEKSNDFLGDLNNQRQSGVEEDAKRLEKQKTIEQKIENRELTNKDIQNIYKNNPELLKSIKNDIDNAFANRDLSSKEKKIKEYIDEIQTEETIKKQDGR